jgi:membrane protein DedA with SNARE-associated domain
MHHEGSNRQGNLIWGIILIAIGFIFLLSNWDIIPDIWESWPIILIVIGVALILVARRKEEEEKKAPEQKAQEPPPPPEQKA